jgi:hypothetical protein
VRRSGQARRSCARSRSACSTLRRAWGGLALAGKTTAVIAGGFATYGASLSTMPSTRAKRRVQASVELMVSCLRSTSWKR